MTKPSSNKPKLFLNNPCPTTEAKLVIMHGFPGAGKSAYGVRLRDARLAYWLSRDELRASAFHGSMSGYDPEIEAFVLSAGQALTMLWLRAGISVVWDATNLTRWHRDQARSWARAVGATPMVCSVPITIEEAIYRCEGRIGKPALLSLARKVEPFGDDETDVVEIVDPQSHPLPEWPLLPEGLCAPDAAELRRAGVDAVTAAAMFEL